MHFRLARLKYLSICAAGLTVRVAVAEPQPEVSTTSVVPEPAPGSPIEPPRGLEPTPVPAPAPARSPAPPLAPPGELDVRVTDEQGTIFVDDEEVGQGRYRGTLAPGFHRLKVMRPGYEPVDIPIEIQSGVVRSESVALQLIVNQVPQSERHDADPDGLYGGFQLLAAFLPTGSGTTFEDACDTTGATSCDASSPIGAGLHGYIGWLFDPLGLELALLSTADVAQQSAFFDGEQGSEINPIVAAPQREEDFTIGRFGAGAAVRARLSQSISRFRFSFALGPGLIYRTVAFRRETAADDGFSGELAETGINYVSPMVSGELAAELKLGRTTALSFGVISWFEDAGEETTSEPRNDTVLLGSEGERPFIQATPQYDLANGPQWFIGPFLGVAFGR